MDLQLISTIGLPLLFAIGGVAAWRASRKQVVKEEAPGKWRDTSLDDWKRERDAELEVERAQRAQTEGREPGDATVGQEQQETKRQQRIGG
jgi:hypothetical protein